MTHTTLKKWLHFTAALFCLWVFVFIIAPALQSIQSVNTMHQYIEANNIDATALYYTDSPEFNGADIKIHSAIQHRSKNQ